jgi:hypothetical protein
MLVGGGCACRSIRYECTEEPIVQLICHCRACQLVEARLQLS